MVDPVLTATLSGQRKILLSWTFGSNADFQVFWKSSSPPGQEYVLLATTNAFSYTTADLDPSKTYYFYVRANVGELYFYSNVVELFVSCGKGVILSAEPPSPPPAQIPIGYIYAAWYDGYVAIQSKQTGDFVDTFACGDCQGIATAPNGDLYIAEYNTFTSNGIRVWPKVGGGPIQVGAVNTWFGISVNAIGDAYAATWNSDDIYKRTGGAGDFVPYGVGGGLFSAVCSIGNDTYINKGATSTYGNSWTLKQSGGSGPFSVWLTHPSAYAGGPNFMCMVGNSLGDLFLGDYGTGNIYKIIAGESTYNLYAYVAPQLRGMAIAPNGDFYACIMSGKIYKQSLGSGSFSAITTVNKGWQAMAMNTALWTP